MTESKPQSKPRRRRADGEISRGRILDAAGAIAAERGYDGTTIGSVSGKCGLPASSIYWHFKDKDDLLAAVIDRSFGEWLSAWELPTQGSVHQRAEAVAGQIATALQNSPDFIRLGLMLALECRPVEPQARARFISARGQAYQALTAGIRELSPALRPAEVHELATYALAGADGLFIAKELGGDDIDLVAMFTMHARSVIDSAARMLDERAAS